MKDLRERCKKLMEKIADGLLTEEGFMIHELESFAREIASQARLEALEEAVKAAEDAKCGSETPWDCGCTPGIKAIRALALAAGVLEEKSNGV